MTDHQLRTRIDRLERHLTTVARPGIAELLRSARERLHNRRQIAEPDAIHTEDLDRWRRLAADGADDSVAARLARARLQRLREGT